MTEQKPSKRILAFIYDFDGTLCDDNLLDQQMLKELGSDPKQFWPTSNERAKKCHADRVCTYMHELMLLCSDSGRPLSRQLLHKFGAQGILRAGLIGENNWFERLNRKCENVGLIAHHYIISSGLGEMIDSCLEANKLTDYFCDNEQSHVFASRFFFDQDEIAVAPAWTVNYTTKTQFVFRINKGKLELGDDKAPNEYMAQEQRPVPFENMVFIGDGYSDIPCF